MDVVEKNKAEPESIGLAFTYNEPTIYYEFMLETAQQSKASGMKNMVVSNGFIQHEPLMQLMPYIDAFNIDLKAYCKKFYSNVVDGRLEPVLQTLKTIRNSGKHLEVTFLLIPPLNDDPRKFKAMVSWISDELGKQTVLHISRYFPAYKSSIPKTGVELLFSFCETARAYLDYVYLGNITGSESQNTMCSQCGKIAISRFGNFIQKNGMDHQGRCVHCKNQIVII
jgi:pyruvate formate lyase activating enzyme